MRWAAGVLAVLLLVPPATAAAQGFTGEFRLLGVVGSALGSGNAGAPPESPPPDPRTLVGISGSLSFIHGGLTLGPEAMVLRGSDRRMYELGGVARVLVGSGRARPYILLGAGHSSWDRKIIPSYDPAGRAAWVGDHSGFSGNAGAGLVVGAGSAALVLEVRGHKSLSRDEFSRPRDMLSIAGGGRLSW